MGGGGGWLLIRVLFCESSWLGLLGRVWGLARGDGDGAFGRFKLFIVGGVVVRFGGICGLKAVYLTLLRSSGVRIRWGYNVGIYTTPSALLFLSSLLTCLPLLAHTSRT